MIFDYFVCRYFEKFNWNSVMDYAYYLINYLCKLLIFENDN